MQNTEFTPHTGNERPVPAGTFVSYRTLNGSKKKNKFLHTHLPVLADKLNWTEDAVIGRIVDYAIADKPNLAMPWLKEKVA